MNGLVLVLAAAFLYVLAHRLYAPLLARVFGEDDARPTPAHRLADGIDYVPTRPHVLFAHHFSAIAAAGPILGPTMAILYGYVPAILWIVLGAILIGAVHDYACLFVSMREDGHSIAKIAHKVLGTRAFVLYTLFIVFNLVVVNAVFIKLTAVSLTSMTIPAQLGLPETQTIFRTEVGDDGKRRCVVGGIASTSAIVLTLVAPALGWLVVRRGMPNPKAYPIATVLCIGSVLAGFALPVSLPTDLWTLIIALYVWVAAALPVWLVLQPREFVSVQFLYLGILLLAGGIIGAGIRGTPIQAPAASIAHGEAILGAFWPTLFITIACGATSGFHGLVSSGTTAKQVARESDAKHIGYLGMLGESALALCVTLAIATGVSAEDYALQMVRPPDAGPGWQANPVLAFSLGVAGTCEAGLGIPRWLGILFGLLMVEGFVLDTLDVSIRLNRYLLEEVWSVCFSSVPRILRSFWVNSGISVLMMLALAYGNTAQQLWPIFGTGNQLLAALSLLAVSAWFLTHGRRTAFVLVPAVLVGTTTLASLVYLLGWRYIPKGNHLLAVTDVLFLALALGVIVEAARAIARARPRGRPGRGEWMVPGQPPQESKGSADLTMVLGGRFLPRNFNGEFMGESFEGIGLTDFDNIRQRYTSIWADDAGTQMLITYGTCEGNGRLISAVGTLDDALTGKRGRIRTVRAWTARARWSTRCTRPGMARRPRSSRSTIPGTNPGRAGSVTVQGVSGSDLEWLGGAPFFHVTVQGVRRPHLDRTDGASSFVRLAQQTGGAPPRAPQGGRGPPGAPIGSLLRNPRWTRMSQRGRGPGDNRPLVGVWERSPHFG